MKMTNAVKLTVAAMTATFGLVIAAIAQNTADTLPPASTKQGVTYAIDIKAILDASCVKCHSGDKPKARLKLDTLADTLKPIKGGSIIKSGDSANSLIVKITAHLTPDQETWMPPLKNKAGIKPLTPEQIGLIRAWIDQGAK
jgi:mono/diheme cytochrome c family protein